MKLGSEKSRKSTTLSPLVMGAALLVWLLLSPTAAPARGQTDRSDRRIPAGTYHPFYPMSPDETIPVTTFLLDATPVTNAEFLRFVQAQPRWQRDRAPSALVGPRYLNSWGSPTELGEAPPNAPVAFVSWFAAANYCDALGKRLPTEAEWEFVGQAGERVADARQDPDFTAAILRFYSRPRPRIPSNIRDRPANLWGVYDMHGLHWEWVSDFNASIVTGDNRQTGDNLRQLFCGGAAVGAADVTDYAAFMRFAFRGSLEATYTLHNLGFRCAHGSAE